MNTNYLAMLVAAFVPMIIGFLWYGPLLFQKAWMKETGITEEKLKNSNMPLILGLSFFLSFLIATFLQFIVIHQHGIFQTLINEPGFTNHTGDAYATYKQLMLNYGDRFRTFPHGMIHGVMTGILLITPIISIKALLERKSFKYIAINAGYWILSLSLMGGIVCQWA